MYRCITEIKIEQQPSVDFPKRKTILNFDFVNRFENSDSWRDFTNKGKIILPKNLYFRDETGKLQPLAGSNINVGGFSSNDPLFLRGDKVTITAGYKYYNRAHREIEDTAVMAVGYISKVGSKIPIELDIEDNMWVLKQTPVETHTFTKNDTLEEIMKFILKGTGFTTNALTKTTFGEFTIGNETAAQVLQRLQKTYGFEFYFRGNELRGGTLIYIESDAQNEIFGFQENIIEDDLEYMRKDDIVLSAIAHNTITTSGGYCKDGTLKTKKKRLEVLVTLVKNPRSIKERDQYIVKVKNKGETFPENIEGERRTFFFPDANTTEDLALLAYRKLKVYYYTGLRGTFTTFGIPFMRQGDNVIFRDNELPERNGSYKIKRVDYTGGIDGLRQVCHLDYKIIGVNE
jgi:hypothetical protein